MSDPGFRSFLKSIRRSPSATALLLICSEALVAVLAVCALAMFDRTRADLVGPAVGAVTLLIAFAAATWWKIARPFEAGLRESRRTLRSLFVENPEAIGMYDLGGNITRGNNAAISMMKQPAEALLGAHFTKHIAPELVPAAHEAFDVAVRGGTLAFETTFVGANDERIDVRTSLFPHVVNDRIVGIFGVAKDIGELKRANASVEEQSARIRELYEVSATSGRTWKEQIDDALSLVCGRLNFDRGFLVEIVEDDIRMLANVGENREPSVGVNETSAPIDYATLQTITTHHDAVADLRSEDGMRRLVAAPMRFGDGCTGALGLISESVQAEPLNAADRDFIRLVTSLIASALQRGRQQERLDRLAFFDALTGLRIALW